MKVSVAICTWNRCDSLRVTLEQLTQLRIPAGTTWELLVVNNNCSDATDDTVRSFSGRLPVRLLHEPKPGLSFARNHALAQSTGDLVLWTDDDVWVDEGWLDTHLRGQREYGADLVFGMSRPRWEGVTPPWFSDLHAGKFALLDYGTTPFVVTSPHTPFFGLNFGFTQAAGRRLGGFREDLGVKEASGGGEDIDLFHRALDAGMRIAYLPGAVVLHMIPAERCSRDYHRHRLASGLPMYYRSMCEQYRTSRALVGVPRFLYRKALADSWGYLASLFRRDQPNAFHYELQVRRFGLLLREAARVRHEKGMPSGKENVCDRHS